MPYSTNKDIRIYYEVCGEGVPLLLIHANPFDHNLWIYQVSHFSTYFKVIALDIRGYGRSDKPTSAFSLKDMGDDVLAVCRDEGVQEAILLGASVGSTIALWLAIDHAEMFKALILVGGSGKASSRAQDRIRGYTELGVDKYRIQHMEALVCPEFRASPVGRYLLQTFEERNPWLSGEAIARIFRALTEVDLVPHLAGLALPTLVINGELDHSLPGGLCTAEMIPGAVHRILPGTGHACCIEDPAGFDALVEAFLTEHGLMPLRRSASPRDGRKT
ncbi:MAG: alpha/beta fold hydrolase [Deltaproteobacteria bacterium]|nr:alpha/beta fold hydrolase [Deltaproteobacteria bacterium]